MRFMLSNWTKTIAAAIALAMTALTSQASAFLLTSSEKVFAVLDGGDLVSLAPHYLAERAVHSFFVFGKQKLHALSLRFTVIITGED